MRKQVQNYTPGNYTKIVPGQEIHSFQSFTPWPTLIPKCMLLYSIVQCIFSTNQAHCISIYLSQYIKFLVNGINAKFTFSLFCSILVYYIPFPSLLFSSLLFCLCRTLNKNITTLNNLPGQFRHVGLKLQPISQYQKVG